jgi:predicted dinucleotide-binding enzyme
MISVIILGAGNVATHLYKAFNTAEHIVIKQWYNRSIEQLQSFKNTVEITNDITSLKTADVYIIAISDDAIVDLSKALPFSNRLVVHTSGSVSMHDLDKKNERGVF